MKQFLLNLNRFTSVRLLLPVFLGFVILTASTNLPDFDEVVSTYEISKSEPSLISEESAQHQGTKSRPAMVSGKTLGWGQTSDVLP
jgi:hypothetical protein